MATDISLISPGDQIDYVVRVATPVGAQAFEVSGSMTVGGVFLDRGLITSDDGKMLLFDNDENFSYRITEFDDGLPKNAPVISWVNGESVIETAAVAGHPGNGVWAYQGRQVESKELLAIIGPDAPITAYYGAR